MLPARLRNSLFAVHGVAAATLLRSIFYDRWITVLASLLLITGAAAALRGKTWGVGIALGAAISFPVAWAIGIAPFWFCFVGIIGALPFALTSKSIARFDAAAAAIGTTLAVAVGALCAIGFREAAPYLFENFPSLRPSAEANHFGLAMALMAGTTLVIARRALRSNAGASAGAVASGDAHARIASEISATRVSGSDTESDDVTENAAPSIDESAGNRARS